jgi:REP element-mobilizing transposase RayT
LQQSAVVLDGMQRQIVEATLAEVCEYRRWKLYAANARTNHVHAVVEALAAPERMLVDFKAYSTRRLAERGLAPGERVWNRHGSTRYLWCVAAVEAACHYVEHMQDEPREGTLGDPRLPSVADPWSEGCHAGGHEQVVPPA